MTRVLIFWVISLACFADTTPQISGLSEPLKPAKHFFDVELADEVSVKNVVYDTTSKTNRGTIKFRHVNGLEVIDGQKNCEGKCSLTNHQFEELLAKSISTVRDRISGADIFGLHFDLLLVQEMKDAAVATVESQSAKLVGTVGKKEPFLDAAIRDRLNNLEATEHVCATLASKEVKCRPRPVDFNPVVFNENLAGKPWMQVLGESNAGLHHDNWISLMIERGEK